MRLTLSLLAATALCACAYEPDRDALGATNGALVTIQGQSCVPLLAGQTIDVGTVCAAVVDDQIAMTYTTTSPWLVLEAHLWVDSTMTTLPVNKAGNPVIGHFPYSSGSLAPTDTFTFYVPLAKFGMTSDMTACVPLPLFAVAHAVVGYSGDDGSWVTETAYGAGPRIVVKGNWATRFGFTLACEDDEPPPPVGCETAFAYIADGCGGVDAGASTCFLDLQIPDFTPNRWGWTNGPLPHGTYELELAAAAGQCDLGKGFDAGSVTVVLGPAESAVTLATSPGVVLRETHVYIGSGVLPLHKGKPTVAPGQYPWMHEGLEDVSADSYALPGVAGPAYVIVHAIVCK